MLSTQMEFSLVVRAQQDCQEMEKNILDNFDKKITDLFKDYVSTDSLTDFSGE